ncbi:MAG: hypothetical protein M3440_06460 [Chloroflexota bacterium]|nr:hypothetical protein [Chloroflexota bacterium]
MSDDTTYNGWTNYATWRVNMEICDGMTSHLGTMIAENDMEPFGSIGDLADYLRDDAEEFVCDQNERCTDSIVYEYASTFLSQVNWDEIARLAVSDDAAIVREGVAA